MMWPKRKKGHVTKGSLHHWWGQKSEAEAGGADQEQHEGPARGWAASAGPDPVDSPSPDCTLAQSLPPLTGGQIL